MEWMRMSSYEEYIKKVDEKKTTKENQSDHLTSFSSFDHVSNKIDQIIKNEPISRSNSTPNDFKKEKKDSFNIEPREQLEKQPMKPDFRTDNYKEPIENTIDEKEELFEISRPKKPKKSLSIPIHISKPKKDEIKERPTSDANLNKDTVSNFFNPVESSIDDNTESKKKLFQLNFNLFSKKDDSEPKNNPHATDENQQILKEKHPENYSKNTGFNIFKKESEHNEKDKFNADIPVSEPVQEPESLPIQQADYEPHVSTNQGIDEEVLKLLAITDELLGKLPEDVISEFAASEDFILYEKVMKKYNILKDES
jgi:hypothetical protein